MDLGLKGADCVLLKLSLDALKGSGPQGRAGSGEEHRERDCFTERPLLPPNQLDGLHRFGGIEL